jgi:hypothetical protein
LDKDPFQINLVYWKDILYDLAKIHKSVEWVTAISIHEVNGYFFLNRWKEKYHYGLIYPISFESYHSMYIAYLPR